MFSNFNYYPQQPQPQQYQYLRPQTPVGLRGRPVASFEEVRATAIDFDGSIFYFPDQANKRIYTKQINMDGTATLQVYELKDVPAEPEPEHINYVTREELEAALADLKRSLVPIEGTIGLERPKQEVLKF